MAVDLLHSLYLSPAMSLKGPGRSRGYLPIGALTTPGTVLRLSFTLTRPPEGAGPLVSSFQVPGTKPQLCLPEC